MKGIYKICLLSSIFFIQPAFADMDDNKSCKVIVKSCLDAGYNRENGEHKKFWQNCLKPVLLGQTVEGVKVDPTEVKDCRQSKIEKMKQELKELEDVK